MNQIICRIANHKNQEIFLKDRKNIQFIEKSTVQYIDLLNLLNLIHYYSLENNILCILFFHNIIYLLQ